MSEVFTAAPHHDVLVVILQIAVLLLAARFLSEVAQRLGQPSVIGELLAGVLLGPSFLSALVPGFGEWILPQNATQGHLLELVALLGAMFLLLITGFETDLTLIRRHARTALGVSWGGILVTFSSGFVLGWALPEALVGAADRRLVFSLFVATAMSISAIPVIAKVLIDLDLMRRDVGQTILAAGMNDDTVGWILLGIVAGLARSGAVSAGSAVSAVLNVVLFLGISFTLGRWALKRAVDYVQDEVQSRDRLLTLVVGVTFLGGAITQALGLEPVLGAFVMGILFGHMRRLPDDVHSKLESMALGIFAPVFFAVAGLKVDVGRLLDPQLAVMALLVIVVASVGKIVGTYLGARLIGRKDPWTALSYGAGLNARGAMEIIIATIGLNLGILNQDMFSIIVLMAIVTSLMAPFALRAVFHRMEASPEELERLQMEETAAGTLFAGVHRVLLPVRPRADSSAAVQLVETKLLKLLAERQDLAVTLFSVVRERTDEDPAANYLKALAELFQAANVTAKVVMAERVEEVILDEATKDYDLMVIGGPSPKSTTEMLFSPLVDFLVRASPVPTVVVHGADWKEPWTPRRILVPTNGSLSARRAAELAFLLAEGAGAEVTVVNVVVRDLNPHHLDLDPESMERRVQLGQAVVDELVQLGESMGAEVEGAVRIGPDPESVVLEAARRHDLAVLGTSVRVGSERLFLGPRVERILDRTPCPVLLVNTE